MKLIITFIHLVWFLVIVCNPVFAESLTTAFDSNNGASGNFFNITAKTRAIRISSFDINIWDKTNQQVDVYYRPGTYKSFESSSSGWNFLGRTVVSGTRDQPAQLPVGGLRIPAGETYGLLIYAPGFETIKYTDGTGSNEIKQNGDLSLFADTGVGDASSPFSGATDIPRVWNGTVYYSIDAGDPAASEACFVVKASNGNVVSFCL